MDKLVGMDKVLAKLEDAWTSIEAEAVSGMQIVGNDVLGLSNLTVPKDTRALRESAYSDVDITDGNWRIEVGYGHPEAELNPVTKESPAEYAVKVHENLFVRHKEGEEAKFLESAFALVCMGGTVENTIAEEVAKWF